MKDAVEEVFPVRRQLLHGIALCIIAVGILGGIASLFDGETWTAGAALMCVGFGAYWRLAVRNVREIRVDQQAILFLPVGFELSFKDIESLEVPGWADRHDNPPNLHTQLVLKTRSTSWRLVPGAAAQVDRTCRLDIRGCETDRLFELVRSRVPEA